MQKAGLRPIGIFPDSFAPIRLPDTRLKFRQGEGKRIEANEFETSGRLSISFDTLRKIINQNQHHG
jgi:hypothetical protein